MVIAIKYATSFSMGIAQSNIHDGQPAPETVFMTTDDTEWKFSEAQGKVVLVEYWAPWCMPCINALPHLQSINEKYQNRDDFQLVSITSSADRSNAQQIFKDRKLEWELLFSIPDSSKKGDFQPTFIPAAYIIGRDGKVVASTVRGQAIDRKLEQLLGKQERQQKPSH